MVTITNATLRSSMWETIYDTLTAAHLLSSTVTVTASYIDSATAPFPQVVLYPMDVEKSEFSFDRSNSRKDINVMIDIWTRKNKDKDTIADAIDVLLSALNIPGVSLIGWSEANAVETENDNKIHLKTLTLTYIRA